MFNDVVSTRDFPKGPNEPDDYLRFRRAADAFLAGQRAGTVGTFHIAAGNVLLGQELRIEQPNGAALFGRIIGEGPEVTTIRTYAGKRAITLVNPNVMEIAGFKLSGGPAKTNSLDHAGLVLSNLGSGVGHGCSVSHVRAEHYGIGLSMGDYVTGGAAAEIEVRNYGANQCHFGVAGFGLNTLNNTFHNVELNECDNGVYSDSAYGWNFIGGSLGNNGTSFNFRCGGEVFIIGMRDEWGPKTGEGGFIQYGASTSIRLIVQSCQVLDQVKGRTILEAIKPVAGETTLILQGSFITGTASASKFLCQLGNSFVTSNPTTYLGTPTDKMVRGNVRCDRDSGAPIADIPREDGPGGGSTPPGPAPGTAPIYKVRWDNVGALTTANRSANVTLPLKFTNTGNTTLGAGDRLTYWWVKDAKPGNYGDRTPLTSLPVGASWMPLLTVLVPSVAGNYTLRLSLVHEPSTWFSQLDISVAVT